MRTIGIILFALAVAGCSMAAPEHRIGKDFTECHKRGIYDAMDCDAAYDSGRIRG